jgi:hypothetical protein
VTEPPNTEASVKSRVFDRLSIAGSSECWEWKGRLNNAGYGMVWRRKGERPRTVLVHRFVYELVRGPIPSDRQIDHLCRNRACGNPQHMELVTSRENTLRGEGPTAQNARKTHCIHGHEFTPENTIWEKKGRKCRMCAILLHRRKRARLRGET